MKIKSQHIIASLAFFIPLSMPSLASNGSELYGSFCAACHGTDGKGDIPGTPDFTSKKGPLSKDNQTLHININDGFQSPGSSMAMPPKGGNPNLSDADIQELVKFLKESFYSG